VDLGIAADVAVVVGGANGIGWAMSAALLAEGARVAIVDRDPATVDKARDLSARSGVEAVGFTADVSDYPGLCGTRDAILDRFGSCRHVMFAAGAGSGRYGFPFWDLAPADWPRVLEINILGAVHTAHAFVDALRASAPATLLFVSSIAGQIGSQTDPPYSAAKAALINFTQCAAKDLAPYQVRVNAICPGMIKTDLNRAVWQAWWNKQKVEDRRDYEPWAEAKIRRVTPLGRWQSPEDVAALAVWLASRRAENVTGQTMNVDGGQVMR
jgi:2-hydroxycyclohexanecarboxyl-CoA dehydrogenase